MKSEPISSYIHFGTCVRFLQDAEPEWKIFGDGYVLDNINTFLEYLEEFNLPVTTRVAYELLENMGAAWPKPQTQKSSRANTL
jgi:hypothetical protein